MTEINTICFIIISSILYGITMKVADLLDEHGLKLFKGSEIFFGFLWGIFGSLLIILNNDIGNIILAMIIACIIRNRLDYLNHQIAASLIIISFLYFSIFNSILFFIFYLIFLIFGLVKDYMDDVLKKKGLSAVLSELMLYYPIPTFIYCLIFGNWIIFWSFLLYTVSYDLTKLIAKRKGYN